MTENPKLLNATRRYTIRFHPKEYDELKIICDNHGLKISSVLRLALRKYLKDKGYK